MFISYYVVMSVWFYDEIIYEIINNNEYLIFDYFENKLYEEVYFEDKYNKLFLYYICENGNVNLFNFYYNFICIVISLNIRIIIFLDFVFLSVLILYKNEFKIVDFCNIYLFFLDISCEI